MSGGTCYQCIILNTPQASVGAAVSGEANGGSTTGVAATGREGPDRAAADDISTLVDTGNAFFRQGNYEGAIQYDDRALTIDPNNKDVLFNIGNVLFSQGNYEQAMQYDEGP